MKKNTPFPKDTPLTAETVEAFLHSVKEGMVHHHVRSQEPPEDDSKNAVKTVVGTTFEQLVVQSNQSVLVDFYAPCKYLVRKRKRKRNRKKKEKERKRTRELTTYL